MGLINLDPTKKENQRFKHYKKNYEICISELEEKYKNFKIEDFYYNNDISYENIPYYYSSNYSNPAYVCHYLNRNFPYSFIAWSIQGTSFDAPDRLFINIEKSYKNCVTLNNDLREIIPQFFYFPEMFLNLNKLNLGKLQKNKNENSTYNILKELYNIKDNENVYVNNVLLPKWCNNNPYQFISIYRELLELLKEDINEWINLIFGIYSRGEKAKEKCNLFISYSYNDIMDKKLKLIKDQKEKDSVLKALEFGLIPNQILYEPIIFDKNNKEKDIKNEEKDIIINIKESDVNLSDFKYIFRGNYDNNIITFFDNKLNHINVNIDSNNYLINKGKLENNQIKILNLIYILKGELIIALSDDNNLYKITNLKHLIINEDKNLDKILISIIYVDKNKNNLYIGTNNGSIIIYDIEEIMKNIFNPIYYLNHSDKITCIYVNNELNMLIDSSNDGYINLYTLPKMEIVNSIYKKDIVKNIFLSSSPLPSFVIYINNKFECYNINCENINIQSPYYNIIIEDDNNLNNVEKNEIIKSKKCKIEYQNVTFKYLEEDNCKLDNAIIVTNNNLVDYLLYEMSNFIIIRKFPFMIMTQTIHLININHCLFTENSNDALFFNFDIKTRNITIKLISKSNIGNKQSNFFSSKEVDE